MFNLLILLPMLYLLLLGLLSLLFLILFHLQTFLFWVLPGQVSLSCCSTSSVVLLVSLLLKPLLPHFHYELGSVMCCP